MWTDLLQTHGYWVLGLGCLLEGEAVLLMAGFAAHRGYLDPLTVLAIAAGSGFAGDQFWFWLGRHHGDRVLNRWPGLARRAPQLEPMLERWHAAAIVGVRFAYGLRVAGPVLMGMSSLPAWQFALYNALGALLWALVIGSLGWSFGEAATRVLGEIRHLEGWLLAALGLGGVVWWVLVSLRRRRASSGSAVLP